MREWYRKEKVGLVLSGGGTKGAYQVGAFRALKELNVNIAAVTGASIGAINGALIVQDDLELMEKLFRSISLKDILSNDFYLDESKNIFNITNITNLVKEYIKQGGISNDSLKKLLIKYIDVNKIYKSKIDYGMLAFSFDDFNALEVFKEDIKKEDFIDHLLASACFPVFKPHLIDEKKYMDGGIYDNVPINMLIKKGYKNIIVIDFPGFRFSRKNITNDVYIKSIVAEESVGGTFEFNIDNINKNIKLGYLDTMKAFNKLNGNKYYLTTREFKNILDMFNLNIYLGLESAALIYDIDRYKVYKAKEFFDIILEKYNEEAERYNKIKDSLNFDFIIKNIKEIKDIIKQGIGLSLFVDLMRYRTDIISNKILLKYFEEYIHAARSIIELENYNSYQFKVENIWKK